MPPNSNKISSKSNYGSIADDEEDPLHHAAGGPVGGGVDETAPLQLATSDDSSGDSNGIAKKNKKKQKTAKTSSSSNKTPWIVGAIATVAAVAAVSLFARYKKLSKNEYDRSDLGGGPSAFSHVSETLALSESSPDGDLGLLSIERSDDATPSPVWGNRTGPKPTNSWYLNLVSHKAWIRPDEASRVYTYPYIVDTAPAWTAGQAMAGGGVRVHWPVLQAAFHNAQMVDDWKNGISLGTMDAAVNPKYTVHDGESLSQLGVSLKWDRADDASGGMSTHIVRGMPYVTVQYRDGVLPALYSYNGPGSNPPLIDGTTELECGSGTAVTAKREIQLHFINADFTWIVFFSRPVKLRCGISAGDFWTRDFHLNVTEYGEHDGNGKNAGPLTVRLALLDQCTTGKANIKKHCDEKKKWRNDGARYVQLLRNSSHAYPASPVIDFDYPSTRKHKNQGKEAAAVPVVFDWDARSSKNDGNNNKDDNDNMKDDDDDSHLDDLIMFALPHHRDLLGGGGSDSSSGSSATEVTDHCLATFHGKTCLVKGRRWRLSEDVSEIQPVDFTAKRPPAAAAVSALAAAVRSDLEYRPSDNMLRAAADTYFPGKLLARMARVIVIAAELRQLAAAGAGDETAQDVVKSAYTDVDDGALRASCEAAAAAEHVIPPLTDVHAAVRLLKKGVEIWLQQDAAEAPYLYDASWGGLVNCGCHYSSKDQYGVCKNDVTAEDCPALSDVNEDFGNGYYNDHHFHYGYHIYAAAVVARFDPEWGKQYFDKVLLYVRDIANPSAADPHFAQFRHKDWWLGSSWASGIVSAENSPHGRNQESSSEAVAAYEAVALYGQVMSNVFRAAADADDEKKKKTAAGQDDGSEDSTADADAAAVAALLVRDVGQLLTATEVRAANRYWHVWSSDTHANTYPAAYTEPVVGMLYETQASFQTWFAPQPVVSYGIQLMPFTAVAEQRDDPAWAARLYPLYEKSCAAAGDFCVDNGWIILQAGLLATTGKMHEALEQTAAIPADVFDSQGGLGNSRTNTVWYIATRKQVNADVNDGAVTTTTTTASSTGGSSSSNSGTATSNVTTR